jgi:CHAT domain-containing protein
VARGDTRGAIALFRESADAIERLRGRIVANDQRAAFAEAAHTTYARLVGLLMDLHRQNPAAGFDRAAFLAVERERTQNVVDALVQHGVDRSREYPVATRARQRQVERRVAELQVQLASVDLDATRRSALLAQLDDAERALAPFAQGGIAMADSAEARGGMEIPALQRSLRAGEAAIVFAVQQARVAFVVTSDAFMSVDVEGLDAIEQRADLFRRLLTGSRPSDAVPVGLALSKAFVQPVVSRLSRATTRLLLVAAGDLSAVPFAALPDADAASGPGGARPLLSRFEIGFLPSLTSLAQQRRLPHKLVRRDLLAIGAPTPQDRSMLLASITRGGELGPLPFSRREAEVAARYGEHDSEVLLDDSAREARVKQRPLGEFRVLHFATHALLDNDVPSRSAIVLGRGDGEDGLLQPREIYAFDLAADLVVLSACRTAAGHVSAAEGIHSLSRAFLYAGARSVLGTLWDIDDRAASELLEHFYVEASGGGSVAGALRNAQLRAAGPAPYTHPADWAAFVLVGDPDVRPALRPRGYDVRSASAWLVLTLAALAAAGVWISATRRTRPAIPRPSLRRQGL